MKRSTPKYAGKPSWFPAALFNRRAAMTLTAGVLLLASHSVFAADSTWILGGTGNTGGGTGNFNTAADWTPGIPTSGINANIANGGTVLITTNETVANLNAGGTNGGGNGTYMQTSGTVTQNSYGWLRLGASTGTSGTYSIDGGAAGASLVLGDRVHIGEANGSTGTGTLNITGTGTGTTVTTVTHSNTAQAFILGGTIAEPFGQPATTVGTGVVNLSGTAILNNSSQLWLGQNTGSTGTMNISGGTLNQGTFTSVGRGGGKGIINLSATGVINQTGGDFIVGDSSSTGTLNQSGGTINNTGGVFVVGTGSGTGTFTQTGGALNNLTHDTRLGQGGSGSYTMSAGTATLGALKIGDYGTGPSTLTITGGTMTAGRLDVGNFGNQVATLTLSGTGLLYVQDIHLGTNENSSGTLQINGGTLATSGIFNNDGNATGNLGQTDTINFNGGTLQAVADSANFLNNATGIKTFKAQVQASGAVIDTNSHAITISAPLLGMTNDGGLTKIGTGVLKLNGTNTYTGATTITAGTLQVGSGGATPTGSIATTGRVAVGGGTTLITASNGALNNTASAVNLGDGNGSATIQNGAFTGATAANNIQQAGALSLGLGTANILDFNNLFGTYDFSSASGSGFSLSGTSLNIRNFGGATNESTVGGNFRLLFDNALTTAQLGDISFRNSDSSQFGAIQQFVNGTSGQVQILEGTSPAPESAQAAALGFFGLGLGALILKARKRSVGQITA